MKDVEIYYKVLESDLEPTYLCTEGTRYKNACRKFAVENGVLEIISGELGSFDENNLIGLKFPTQLLSFDISHTPTPPQKCINIDLKYCKKINRVEEVIDRAIYIAAHELETLSKSYMFLAALYKKLDDCREDLNYYGYNQIGFFNSGYGSLMIRTENIDFEPITVRNDPFFARAVLSFGKRDMEIREETDFHEILKFLRNE